VKESRVKWIAAALMIGFTAPAIAQGQERYDPQRAGHPLRIIAYVLHPVGWVLDRLIFFPAWWIGGHEPLRSIVGHDGLPERHHRPVLEPALENEKEDGVEEPAPTPPE
jgi:hypothetical protein